MDPLNFFSQARAFVVTGKGGVGKTTLSGVMANLAALEGLRAVVQLGTPARTASRRPTGLARLFGPGVPGYEAVLLRSGPGDGEVRGKSLGPIRLWRSTCTRTACAALQAPGEQRSTGRRSDCVPGMPDMLVLGKLKQIERLLRLASQVRRTW